MDGNFTDLNSRTTALETNYIKTINGLSADSNAVTITTANITENTNLYYTDARTRAAISVADTGGDGSLSYDSSTGVITYIGPAASEVRAHISATTASGVTYDNSTGIIELANIPNSSISNSSFFVAANSGSNAIDLGDTLTVTGSSGIVTSQSGDTLTITIDANGVNDTHIDFGTGANQVNTADLPEDPAATGSSGTMYYTDARADARIAAASIDDLSDVVLGSTTDGYGLTWVAANNRLELAELPGAAGGEANQMQNQAVADSVGLFKTKIGVTFQMRSITSDSNVVLTQNADYINIALASSPEFGNIKINSAANTIENTSTNSDIILKPNGTGSVLIDGTLEPNADSSYTLGASGNEWSVAYIDTVAATTVSASSSIIGTLGTAAQTNITSVGTLNGLTIAGSQTVDMGANKVTNMATPTAGTDAATKAYVDSALSSGTTIFTLQADGGSNDTVSTGDTIDFEGTANEIQTTVSPNKITIGLPNNVTVTNNLTVGGDLTVTGTTTTVDSQNLSIADSFIYLNGGDAIGDSGTNFVGSGLDDGTFKGYFEGATSTTYYVRIDGTGTPDTFEWSKDNFSTTEATGVSITGSQQSLDNNITIEFAATTGHTSGDVWSGTAAPIARDAGFWANENNGTGKYGYTHVGIYWDQSERTWKAVGNYTPEPTGTINTGSLGFEYGNFEVKNLKTGSLEISGTEIKAINSNEGLELAASGTGTIQLQSDTLLTAQSDLRFGDADSSNYVAFQAPATVASNITWTLPNADAAVSGYALVSNASGTLSWAAAGATTTSDTTTNAEEQLYFGDITSGAVTAVHHDAGLTYNPSLGRITADTFNGALSGNAATATKWATGRTISLTGDVTGTSGTFDGSGNLSFATTIAANSVALGTDTTGNYVAAGAVSGNGLSGSAASEGATFTVTSNATNANTASTIVFRDGSGNFSAGTITAALSGNATTATTAAACSGNSATATTSTNVTTTDNTATNETVYIAFVDGTSGAQGIEVDSTGLTYNPSTNTLSTSVFSGTATTAQYADLAEMYIPDAGYAAGTVLKVGGAFEVTQCNSIDVPAGVVSENPAYLMNSEQEGGIPVALVGRVRVRIVGPVEKGQVVRADDNGVASVASTGDRVGIALETNTDTGEKLVECMLKV